jgi:asparagine synthetase B (glutamine-hydrolysing)
MHGDGLQYEEVGEDVVGMLDGMFSFVLVDLRDKSFIAARDPIGITPLYLGWGNDGTYVSRSQTFFQYLHDSHKMLFSHCGIIV